VINFDNLTKYDKTLLYQAEHDIIGSPFSLEQIDILKKAALEYESELFEEK